MTTDHWVRLAASLISHMEHKRRYCLCASGEFKGFLVWCPAFSDPHVKVPIHFMYYRDGLVIS